jgi:hypothetical protein
MCVYQNVLPIKLRVCNERSILKFIRQNNIDSYWFSVTHALLKAKLIYLKRRLTTQ